MTHKDAMWDGLPSFSARSVGRGDAAHREARATPSEGLADGPASPAASLLPDGPRGRSLWVIITAPWY